MLTLTCYWINKRAKLFDIENSDFTNTLQKKVVKLVRSLLVAVLLPQMSVCLCIVLSKGVYKARQRTQTVGFGEQSLSTDLITAQSTLQSGNPM